MKGLRVAGIVGGVAILAAIGAVLTKATGLNRPKGPTLLIGDSLAVGLGPALVGLGLNLEHHGMVGAPIAYWNSSGQKILKDALARDPGLIIVVLGTNDAYNGDDYASNAADNARELLTQLGAKGAQVAWVSPPTLPAKYSGRNPSQAVIEAIRKVVQATPFASWIDSTTLNIPRSADTLHPTGEGYRAWANTLIEQLSERWIVALSTPSTTTTPATALTGDVFGVDVPPPPVVIKVPEGWVRSKGLRITSPIRAWLLNLLGSRLPLGDLQVKTFGNLELGALTDLHYDDHVGNKLQWHRGMSVLTKGASQ